MVDEAAPLPPRRWRRIGTYAALALGGLAVLLGAALLWLDSNSGHRFIARQIAGLEFESGMQLSVGQIDGSIYGDMTLRDVAVSDPKGHFLVAQKVQLDWRPFAYLDNHVDIRSLTSPLVTLERVPEFNETDPDAPLLPDLDIDIGEFRIDRFVAAPAVTGEERAGSIAGMAHIADGRAETRLNGQLLAVGEKAGGDRIALALDAVPEDRQLDLDLVIAAPADGVIAALAGLREPLDLKVMGKGDWASWDGTVDAELGDSELARLTLLARDGTFTLHGPTRAARLFKGATATLLGPEMQLDLTAAFDQRRADVQGNIVSGGLRLNADGLIDLGENTFEDFKLAFTVLRPAALAENLSGRGLRGLLTLDGEFATPQVAYSLNADRLVMDGLGLDNLTASGAARVDTDGILIPVEARASRITGLDTVAGGTLANVALAGELAVDGPRILSDSMRLTSDRVDAGLVLVADMSEGFYSGALDGKIDNYRVETVGIFQVESDLDLETGQRGFTLAGKVRARSTSLFSEGVRSFLGGQAVAAGDISYGPDGLFRFSNLRLASPDLRVTGGSGYYGLDGKLALTANGVSDSYGPLGLEVAGTFDDPRAMVTAERPGLGIGLASLRADITRAGEGYLLDGTAETDYGPLTAAVTLGMGEVVTLDIARADLSGIGFTGSLRQTIAGPFAGELVADGKGLRGIARLAAKGDYQQLLVNARATNTLLRGTRRLRIGSAIIDANIVLYDQPHVVADVQLGGTRLDGFLINAARAKVDYRNGSGTAKVLLEGDNGIPFRVAANAEMEPELWRAAITGRARGVNFRTASPARIVPRGDAYELLQTRIDFDKGNVRLAGTYGQGIKLQSRLDGVDLSVVEAFSPGLGINGRASGSLDFAQASADAFPRADARLTVSRFTRTTSRAVSEPVDINFVGNLLADGGEARAVMRQRGTVIGRLNTSLRPLGPGAGDWTERLLAAPLSGGVRYNGPAATLFSLVGDADQHLTGPIAVAADFSGRVEQPRLAGIIRGNKLTYENDLYGTRLSNLSLIGRFAGDRVEVERLQAVAGNGTVSASGTISLAEAAGYPMDLRVKMDKARLARSEFLSTSATGELRLTKLAGQTALLSGSIVLPETRYQLVREGAAQVPELTGVRFKPRRGRQRITGSEPAPSTPGLFEQLRLDVKLAAPERLYVSGMGLESEWNANLTLSGTSADPRLTGQVALVRGTLGFAGRSFELTRGEVGFTGGAEINPTLQLVATEDVEDITVNVNVTGRAYDPQVAFSSVPGLPQDEILARILFGSSIASLSPVQAVQLAASLNSLRGSGGGLNPLGKLRSATGVDRLRVLGSDDATGRGTALAAGKYLTDDIYVEFITDARGFTATQLEISLTPALSILSQAGGSGQTNVNIRYRKNY
ncbi:translocation/assembly module TamB domain-containing protein [Parerythrobacter aestuarii]|uniref:translocation/assembly module TamB domain-containing protein n=1 Tax=Parerythrobacter aestuarii TaxID=3020909 RepID=UPI0024DECC79|nr:translocation/assembly module TamB domain-containing protein [Parerythrobacter aestuarii]